MGEEMRGVEEGTGWRKAIPEARDRLQSRVLVWVVATWLVGLCAYSVFVAYPSATSFIALPVEAAEISLGFSLLVRALRAATPGGAVCGGMICFLITLWTGSFTESVLRTGLTPLIFLFVLTLVSTRAGRTKKARTGLAESRRGRSAAQVIANLSVAALSVSPQSVNLVQRWMAYCCVSGLYDAWAFEVVKVMCVAALAEAAADTVSSEIGQAFGGDPVLIAGLGRVEPGTDGAVTLRGSCAGVAAGALVAIAGGWATHLSVGAVLTALGAGICGLFFDSLLGATVERRGWIGNDLVNFTSTLFAAALAVIVYRFLVL
ncbi:MAG TPA: DUF92 domain-containing protein [Edaphobacter sp.]|nr:DUF92 domain-containing protein [Edaphobacter sp.]